MGSLSYYSKMVKHLIFIAISSLLWCFGPDQVSGASPALSRQQEPDDAIVIEAGDGITPVDGPAGPSIIGSVDNVFKALKDYDQYRCIEKMLCEAMSENTDDIPGLDTLVNAITGESPVSSIPQTLASTFGNGLGGSGSRPPSIFGGGPSRPPTSSSAGSSLFSTFENLIFGKRRSAVATGASHFSRPFGSQHRPVQQQRRPPQRFRQANNIRRPPIRRPTSSNSPFISRREDEAFRPSRPIRTKRQTRLQGNIIRLMQATGMDSLHAFPYVRAALIGHATRDRRTGNRVTRRGSACSQLFQDCPSNSDSLLDYFNNHNGGIFNQVQPSVDNEVAPIVQAILADVVGGGGTSSTGPQTAASTAGEGSFLDSGLFQAGDSLFTNAIINGVTGAIEGGIEAETSIIDSIVDSLVGKKR